MFIGMRWMMLPSSVRSDIRASDVAPDGARAIKTITIYTGSGANRTVCSTLADALTKNKDRTRANCKDLGNDKRANRKTP